MSSTAIHDKGESTVRKSFRLAAGVVALGLVAAACSEDNGTSSGTTAGGAATTAAPATTTATSAATGSSEAPTTTGSSNADRDKVALDYVGATEAKAASGDPITIGYVNGEGVPGADFPENTVGLEAAVDYINSTLGGVQGRPVQIKKCVVQKEEDGQKCAQEMLADDSVKFVLTGHPGARQPAAVRHAGRAEAGLHRQPGHHAGLPGQGRLRVHARLAGRDPGHGDLRRRPACPQASHQGRGRLLGQPGRSGGLQPPDQAHPGEVRHPGRRRARSRTRPARRTSRRPSRPPVLQDADVFIPLDHRRAASAPTTR